MIFVGGPSDMMMTTPERQISVRMEEDGSVTVNIPLPRNTPREARKWWLDFNHVVALILELAGTVRQGVDEIARGERVAAILEESRRVHLEHSIQAYKEYRLLRRDKVPHYKAIRQVASNPAFAHWKWTHSDFFRAIRDVKAHEQDG